MNISTKKELDAAIIELEKRKVVQESLLASQFHETYESFKPSNVIKNLFGKLSQSPGVKTGLVKTITGMAVGMLTKKLFIGKTSSFVGKIISRALQVGVTKTAVSNTDRFTAYGTAIYNNLFKKKTAAPKRIVM